MMQGLLQWDLEAFYWVNQSLRHPIFDHLCPFLRQAYFWIPLYGFIASYALKSNFKQGYKWLVVLVVVFAFSDMISAQLLKPIVERIRPCNALEGVHLLVNCGGGYSFPSAHATNHFALSFFIVYSQRKILSKWVVFLFLFWAAAVSFSQVYVGVHFPLDVLMGAILGWLIAKLISLYYLRYWINKA